MDNGPETKPGGGDEESTDLYGGDSVTKTTPRKVTIFTFTHHPSTHHPSTQQTSTHHSSMHHPSTNLNWPRIVHTTTPNELFDVKASVSSSFSKDLTPC